MSYILDALKKADSERALGSVPALHTRTISPPGLPEPTPVRRALPWLGVLLLLLMVAAGLVWQHMVSPVARPAANSHNAVVAEPGFAALSRTPAAPVRQHEPDRARLESAQAQPVNAGLSNLKLDQRLKREPKESPDQLAQRSGEPAEATIVHLSQLPEHVRRELPAFSIGGSIYSENPADRLLLVNGRTIHEGEDLMPGLTLEQMLPTEVVLRFQRIRFKVPLVW